MTFNTLELTPESVLAARQYYIDLSEHCIAAAETREWYVNDLPGYVAQERQMAAEISLGQWDHSLTFRQRVYFEQTGEDVALLP